MVTSPIMGTEEPEHGRKANTLTLIILFKRMPVVPGGTLDPFKIQILKGTW